jgi:uncharacterized protein (DUF2249 family)
MTPPLRVLDARYLEPPEPFVQTLEMLDQLAPGETMQLLLFREPHPLYQVLQRNGHCWQSSLLPDGTFEILITR